MPPQYTPPDHVPGQARHFRMTALIALGVLALLILWFAATARQADEYPNPPIPAQSTQQANVAEHRLTLSDGRTLTCLTFPGPTPAVSCDWSRAYHR